MMTLSEIVDEVNNPREKSSAGSWGYGTAIGDFYPFNGRAEDIAADEGDSDDYLVSASGQDAA